MTTRTIVHITGSPSTDQLDDVVLNSLDMEVYGFNVAALVGLGPGPGDPASIGPYARLQPGRVQAAPHLGSRNPRASGPAALWWLVQWLRVARPDLVHSHGAAAGPIATLAAAVVGIPTLHTVYRPGNQPPWGPGRNLAGRASGLMVVGEHDLGVVAAARGTRIERCRLVPVGYRLPPPDQCRSGRRRSRHRLGRQHDRLVGVVVDGVTDQDLVSIISAVTNHGDEESVVLLGDRRDRLRLEAIARRTEPGRVRTETIMAPLDGAIGCDAVIDPRRGDPLGALPILTAAHGIPLVCWGEGNISDLVDHGVNGLLGDPSRPDGLAATIPTLIGHLDHLTEGAAKAGAQGDRYGADTMRDRLADWWTELTANPRHESRRRVGPPST